MSNSSASRRMPRFGYVDLSMHVDSCIRELIDRGYAKPTINGYRRGLGLFSRWVTRDRTSWWNTDEELVRRFLSSRGHVHARPTLSAAVICFVSCDLEGASSRTTMVRPVSKRNCNA